MMLNFSICAWLGFITFISKNLSIYRFTCKMHDHTSHYSMKSTEFHEHEWGDTWNHVFVKFCLYTSIHKRCLMRLECHERIFKPVICNNTMRYFSLTNLIITIVVYFEQSLKLRALVVDEKYQQQFHGTITTILFF